MANLNQTSAFIPVVGKCYEIHFGKVTLNGQTGFWSARIRVNGAHPSQWLDIDTNHQLDPSLAVYVVQASREIQCPP